MTQTKKVVIQTAAAVLLIFSGILGIKVLLATKPDLEKTKPGAKGEIQITVVAASAKAAEYEIILEKQAILTVNVTEVKSQQKTDKESSFADYWVILLIIIVIIIILIIIGLLIKRKKQPPPEEPPSDEIINVAELNREE